VRSTASDPELPNGRYSITVELVDVCGNQGSITQRVTIDN
jgi:hypothetical protein